MLASWQWRWVQLVGVFVAPRTARHVAAGLAVFIVLATGSAWGGPNDNANGAWLRNRIDSAPNGAFIMLAPGDYVIDEPIYIHKDITLFCFSIGGASIRSYQGLSDGVNGLVIQDLDAAAMRNGKADVFLLGIVLRSFHRAVHVNPTASDNDKILRLSLVQCGMDYCYYGLKAENNFSAPDFALQDLLVDRCWVTDIQRREDSGCGGIVVRSWFDGAEIKNNLFLVINRQAITLGTNWSGDQVARWNNAEVTGNEVFHVWLNDQAGGGCYGILTFGQQHTIRNNHIENVFSSIHAGNLACTGIYSKAQGPLLISENTLVDAGGKEGALTVKTGEEGLYGSLRADTVVRDNVIYRTTAQNELNATYPDGSVADIYRANRTRGIFVQGNHILVENNTLHHPVSPEVGTGMVIKVERGGDVAIIGNSINYPNEWFGISFNLDHHTGDDMPFDEKCYVVTDNHIYGLLNHDHTWPVRLGIKCVPLGDAKSLLIERNIIKELAIDTWIYNIGVWADGPGTIEDVDITVQPSEIDNTVHLPVFSFE